MRKANALAACLGVAFLFALTTSSARADSICADDMVVKVKNSEDHHLNLPDQSRAGLVHSFAVDFDNNNGKHLGFSVASTNRGLRFGLSPRPQSSGGGTTPNPEPAAVFLLGTGLAAVGAYARRRFRKPSN